MYNQKQILLIDKDYKTIIKLGDAMTAAGYKVFASSDGKEGLKLYNENKFDVLIIDASTPLSDDLFDTVCKKIKKSFSILLKAADREEKEYNLFDIEKAVDYIMKKPVNSNELIKIVKEKNKKIKGKEVVS